MNDVYVNLSIKLMFLKYSKGYHLLKQNHAQYYHLYYVRIREISFWIIPVVAAYLWIDLVDNVG